MTADTAKDARTALLDAGCRLAEQDPRPPLTAQALSHEAGVSETVFRSCFGDENGYRIELHRHFLNLVLDRVIPELSSHPAGLGLQAGVQAFLDVCLQHRGLRSMLLEFETEPEMREAALARRRGFLQMLKLEFEARGWPHAVEAARLYRAMVEEASQAEVEAGQVLPNLRATLWHFIRD